MAWRPDSETENVATSLVSLGLMEEYDLYNISFYSYHFFAFMIVSINNNRK